MVQQIELLGIIATVLAVVGCITNNRRLRLCFLLWLASNTLTGVIHAQAGIWSLLVRDVVFCVLAVDGWIRWKRKDKIQEEIIAAARREQRMLNNKLIEKLLDNAEQYRIIAKGLLGREIKLPLERIEKQLKL